ncbi:hypothetical protein M0813_26860 [Anaeramoeba flamelloides]|uniref:Uncharacterized protein n=1 Tax=Anaeramoeba flamelloides TaxID=1746091 RepID=A0ABQ8XZM3_9EUKA|nr:hypothetical protein M0813_26860 [Anaeramoeba flamelloides]
MSFFNKKLKKKKDGLKRDGSGTTLMENTKKKTKIKKKDLNKLISIISRNCKKLYQITNMSRGNEEVLLDDFFFQEFHNKVLKDRAHLQNLLEKSKLSKKMNKEVEQTLDQISDVLKFSDKSLGIANSKIELKEEKEKQKENQKIGQLLEVSKKNPKEKKRRSTVDGYPKEKQKPQIGILVTSLTQKDSSEEFDDFFKNRQRRYSGSHIFKKEKQKY